MILEISIDPATNDPTVEGRTNHKLGTQGGGMLLWRCEPGKGHKGWKVKFDDHEPSPFDNGQKEFGGPPGADGGRLAERDSEDGEKTFKYSVTCIDNSNEKHEADPEIVVWPD